MDYLQRHKLIALTLLIQVIVLPILLVITRQAQESQGRAEASTSILFSPETSINSPQVVGQGEYFSTDVVVDPGTNLITQTQIEIYYDATKVEVVKEKPVDINTSILPRTIEQPVFEPGRIELSLAVSSDAKPISEKVKVATVYFKALQPVERSNIYFGKNTNLIGINQASNNLLQGSSPQIISISTPSAEPKTTTFPTFRPSRGR